MIWEVVPNEDPRLLTRQSHLMRHLLDHPLIKHRLVKEYQGVAHHQPEEHSVEDTHPSVEEEEEHTTEHDATADQIGFPGLGASLPTRQDRHVVIHQIIIDVLELDE